MLRNLLYFSLLLLSTGVIGQVKYGISLKSESVIVQQKFFVEPNSDEILFSDGFDSGNITDQRELQTKNTTATWINIDLPKSSFKTINSASSFSAVCPWDSAVGGQNEILISKEITLTDEPVHYVSFYAGFSKKWLAKATLNLLVTDDNGATWTKIWTASQDTISNLNWLWRYQMVDALSAYKGKTIKLAWQYLGNDGDLMAIDDVKVFASEGALGAEILRMNVTNQIDTAVFANNAITVKVAVGTNLEALKLDFELSKGANSLPASGSVVSVNPDKPFEIQVFPQNPNASSKLWLLTVVPGQFSKEAQILSFSVPNQTKPAVFDKNSRTIEVEVPFGTDLNNVVPEFTLSVGATLATPDPKLPMQFIDRRATVFEVQPQDPSLPPVKWYVTLSLQDYLTDVLSFGFKDIITKVNIVPTAKTIAIEVPYKTDISKLIPEYTLSAGATGSWESGVEKSFPNNVATKLTITAANKKSTADWLITVVIAENAIFTENFDVLGSFLPLNWSADTLNKSATWQQANQLRNPFSKIAPISKYSALCPWVETDQDEWLISPVINSESMVSIYLKFYAGFSKGWLENANLICYVKAENDTFKEVWNAKADTSTNVQWNWHQVILNISEFKGKNIQIAWQYKGKNGDLVGIDQVLLADNGQPNTEIQPSEEMSLNAYPNPASEYLTIESECTGPVDIWCINGKKVATVKTNETVYIGELPVGIYIIKSANPQSIFKKTIFTKK